MNRKPVAVLSLKYDTVFLPNQSNIILDASMSYDLDGGPLRYSWTRISGPVPKIAADTLTAQAKYSLDFHGTYLFEVTVTDPQGLQARDTVIRIAVHDAYLNSDCSKERVTITPSLLTLTSSPEMFEFGQITMAGSKILFAGGSRGDLLSADVHMFDLSNKTWTKESLTEAAMPVSSYGFGNLAVIVSYGAVDVYDASAGAWIRSRMPFPREGVTAAIIDQKIILAGGNDWFYPPTDRVDIFDLATRNWSSTKLSEARGTMTVVNDGQELYFGGGGLVTGCSKTIDIYHPSNNQWSTAALSESKIAMTGVAVGNSIIWAGGGEVLSAFSDKVEIYNQQGMMTGQDCISISARFYSDGNDVARLDNNTACFANEKFIALYEPATRIWKEGQLGTPLVAVFAYQGKAYGVSAEKKPNNSTVYKVHEIRF